MDFEDRIKNTPQWKALNEIWRSCSKEQQIELYNDFQVVAEFIKKSSDNYEKSFSDKSYSCDFSEELREFMRELSAKGEKDLYGSIMAVIGNHPFWSMEQIEEYYFKKFGHKRSYLIEKQQLVHELIVFCYNKRNR